MIELMEKEGHNIPEVFDYNEAKVEDVTVESQDEDSDKEEDEDD